MRNKFRKGESVIVNGLGKFNKKIYMNRKGSIVERDAFFHDYNVRFTKKEDDWFEEYQLRKIKTRERKIKV